MHWLGMSAGVDADYELVLPRWYLGRHSSRCHFGSIACMSRPSLLHDKSDFKLLQLVVSYVQVLAARLGLSQAK